MAKGKGKNKNSAKTLDYSKQRLTDADIASLKLSQESTAYEEVDFSQNKLSSASLHAIVTLCSRCSNFRVLKVYKNDIDDSGADELAWLFEQCQTLEEVHLSHNRLTARGAKTLASAADWWRKETGSPLWLRMEQNLVASPTQLLRSFENTLSICGREDERRCTTRHCCWKKKVHMPFFCLQKDTWKEDEANVQEDAIAWQDDEWWVDSWQEPRPQRRQKWLPGDDPDSWAAEAVEENWDNAPFSSSRESRKAKKRLEVLKKDSAEAVTESSADADNPITAWAKSVSKVWAGPVDDEPTAISEEKAKEPKLQETKALDAGVRLPKEGKEKVKKSASKANEKGSPINLNLAISGSEDEQYRDRLKLAQGVSMQLATEEEKEKVDGCLKALNDQISGLEPGLQWRAKAFGSVETGFSTRGCDLDVVLIEENGVERSSQQILINLRNLLLNSEFAVQATILSARVPILKLEYEGLELDVSVNNTRPLVNTRLLKAYGSMHPLVRELGVAVKIWAKDAKLCGAPDGHLSSYAFVLMAIYYLQVAATTLIPCLQEGGARDSAFAQDEDASARVEEAKAGWEISATLEILLAGFFAFYAGFPGPVADVAPFDWGKEVVSIRLGRRENSDSAEFEQLKGRNDPRLHIEDPFERGRNLCDVVRTHPQDNEDKLRTEIGWMDYYCRMHCWSQDQFLSSMGAATMPPFWEQQFPGVAFDPQMIERLNRMYSLQEVVPAAADKRKKASSRQQRQKVKHTI